MRCFVYKSLRREDTYVYLAERDGESCLPQSLRESIAPLAFVLEFDLSEQRRLGREDPRDVLQNLQQQGFHLQRPVSADPRHVVSGHRD